MIRCCVAFCGLRLRGTRVSARVERVTFSGLQSVRLEDASGLGSRDTESTWRSLHRVGNRRLSLEIARDLIEEDVQPVALREMRFKSQQAAEQQ